MTAVREHASGPARAENVSGTPGPNARLDDLSLREPGIFAHIVVLATQIGQVGQVGQVGVPADDYSPSLALRFCMLAQSLMKQSRAVRHSSAWYTVAVAMDLPVSALGNAPKENDKGAEFAQMISRFCATLASRRSCFGGSRHADRPQDDDDRSDAARLEEALCTLGAGADLPQGFMAIFHNGSWDNRQYFKRSNRQPTVPGTTALQTRRPCLTRWRPSTWTILHPRECPQCDASTRSPRP